jgi:type IV pilus assembly protein PilB
MGVEPFLVTASVNMIVAQRLARNVCKECTSADESVTELALLEAGMKPTDAKRCTPRRGKGCRACGNTGYRGRIALYEVMVLSDPLKELLLQGASTAELKSEAIRVGMMTLRQSGLNKVVEGTTTLEEVLRVTASD